MRISSLSLWTIVAIAVLIARGSAHAASATWNGTTNTTWSTSTNWSAGGPPGTGDTATFNNAGNANTTISLNGITVNTILFDTSSAAAYTLGSGGVNGQTLTLNFSGAITVNSTVTNNQLFNATVRLGTDGASTGSFTFTNNSATATLTFAGLVSEATANNSNPARTLNLAGSGNGVINGIINGNGASNGGNAEPLVSISKSGTGTWTLSGANTYAGGTTVSAGTLLVNNTTGSGTGSGAVTVNGSGTTLGGTGTITGTVTLGNTTPGAILNPGPKGTAGTAASVGTLRTGALTLTGSNTFHVDASGTLTSNWDQLIVTGGVTLGTTSVLDLTIASGLSFTGGTQYVLISNDLADAISGTFSNAANGSTVVFNGYLFTVNYAGGDGNDFTLTAVPEPSTWIAGALALTALAFSQRRRLKRLIVNS